MNKNYKKFIHNIRDTDTYLRERRSPYITDHSFPTLYGIKKNLEKFIKMTDEKSNKILDLGCWCKPYQSFFSGYWDYIWTDIVDGPYVDIVTPSHLLPFEKDYFDYLICTQSLEHTEEITKTIKEIYRVVKPGWLIFISVPFLYQEHAAPYDFWRFTRFWLEKIFADFEILSINWSTGYFWTMCFFINTLFSHGNKLRRVFTPIFVITNLIWLLWDKLIQYIWRFIGKSIIKNNYNQFTNDYCIILKKA